jgi:hypothetical protein
MVGGLKERTDGRAICSYWPEVLRDWASGFLACAIMTMSSRPDHLNVSSPVQFQVCLPTDPPNQYARPSTVPERRLPRIRLTRSTDPYWLHSMHQIATCSTVSRKRHATHFSSTLPPTAMNVYATPRRVIQRRPESTFEDHYDG